MADLPPPTALRFPAPARFHATSAKTGPAFQIGRPRHTPLEGLTAAAIAFVIMGGAYCLAQSARGVAHSLSHPAVVAESRP